MKWETGRGLPDVSLFENLCLELDISVNELLKGEKITKETEKVSNINLIEYNNYLKRKSRNKKLLFSMTIVMIVLCFSVMAILCCNRTFFKTKYHSEFLDNVEISIPRFSYYRRTGGQYISVFKTLKSTDEINVFIDTYLSTFEKINCNGEIYYYNRKNDYTIFNYSVNNDGYGFINTIYINYNNGKSCNE